MFCHRPVGRRRRGCALLADDRQRRIDPRALAAHGGALDRVLGESAVWLLEWIHADVLVTGIRKPGMGRGQALQARGSEALGRFQKALSELRGIVADASAG